MKNVMVLWTVIVIMLIHLSTCSGCSSMNQKREIIPHVDIPSGNFMVWASTISNVLVRSGIKKTVNVTVSLPEIIDEVNEESVEKMVFLNAVQRDLHLWLSGDSSKVGLGIIAPGFSADYVLVDDLLSICSVHFGNSIQETKESLTISLFSPHLFLRRYSLPTGLGKEYIYSFLRIIGACGGQTFDGKVSFLPDDNTFFLLASKENHQAVQAEMSDYSRLLDSATQKEER